MTNRPESYWDLISWGRHRDILESETHSQNTKTPYLFSIFMVKILIQYFF